MEWILCDERLPDDNREVLISLEWGIDIGTYERGEWRSEWINHYDDDNVLAWMPLPKPYKADRKTENSSEKPNNCECEPRKEQNFCGKCRYLYRDFKYGLSCYRLMDNEPCKYEERKDEPTISKMEQVDKDINVRSKDEPQTDCAWK